MRGIDRLSPLPRFPICRDAVLAVLKADTMTDFDQASFFDVFFLFLLILTLAIG